MSTPVKEEWRPIGVKAPVGRYEVSNYGRVKTFFFGGGRRRKQPRLLKPGSLKHSGHAMYSLSRDNKQYAFLAGRLVLLTFVGPPPDPSYEASHKDGNACNDFVDNLIWETHIDNERRKLEHGTRQSTLSDALVLSLRERRRNGEAIAPIARELGIPLTTAYAASRGKTWKHLNTLSIRGRTE